MIDDKMKSIWLKRKERREERGRKFRSRSNYFEISLMPSRSSILFQTNDSRMMRVYLVALPSRWCDECAENNGQRGDRVHDRSDSGVRVDSHSDFPRRNLSLSQPEQVTE